MLLILSSSFTDRPGSSQKRPRHAAAAENRPCLYRAKQSGDGEQRPRHSGAKALDRLHSSHAPDAAIARRIRYSPRKGSARRPSVWSRFGTINAVRHSANPQLAESKPDLGRNRFPEGRSPEHRVVGRAHRSPMWTTYWLAVMPPSTYMICPVMKPAPGDAKKSTGPATSFGLAMRPRGMRASKPLRNSGFSITWRIISV